MNSLPTQLEDAADSGIDLAGVGKAMKAVPPAAWAQIVDTACTTFERTLAPITETAHGIGRLIKAKFDRLIDVERVLASESIVSARRKAEQAKKPLKTPRPQILLQIVENSSGEVDAGVRELWSNLLAQEMLTQAVHPEIGRVLARISFEDAQLLARIADSSPSTATELFAQAMKFAMKAALGTVTGSFPRPSMFAGEPTTFNHAHLRNLGLIERREGGWELTTLGEGFIEIVTDPSLELEASAEPST